MRKVDGRPAFRDILGLQGPAWEGALFKMGFGADFRSQVPAEFFEGREDPDYVQAVIAQALAELVPDAMNQIHGRLRPDRPEWIDPVAEIAAAYATSENRVSVGAPVEQDGRLVRPTFHRMMGTLELASERKRRWDHMMSGAADKIAELVALNAEQALRSHSGVTGEGDDILMAAEIRSIAPSSDGGGTKVFS